MKGKGMDETKGKEKRGNRRKERIERKEEKD